MYWMRLNVIDFMVYRRRLRWLKGMLLMLTNKLISKGERNSMLWMTTKSLIEVSRGPVYILSLWLQYQFQFQSISQPLNLDWQLQELLLPLPIISLVSLPILLFLLTLRLFQHPQLILSLSIITLVSLPILILLFTLHLLQKPPTLLSPIHLFKKPLLSLPIVALISPLHLTQHFIYYFCPWTWYNHNHMSLHQSSYSKYPCTWSNSTSYSCCPCNWYTFTYYQNSHGGCWLSWSKVV